MASTKPKRLFLYCKVINVVDGDTVDVVVDLGFGIHFQHRFRLAGVNTPERGYPKWQEATDFTTNMVLGKDVICEVTKEDKYGRYLADISVNGMSLNKALLEAGLAVPFMV